MKHFLILFLFFSAYADRVLANSLGKSAYQLSGQVDAFSEGPQRALKENRLEDALEEFTTAERERLTTHAFAISWDHACQLGKNAEAAAEYRESIRLDPLLEDAIAIWDFSNGPNTSSSQLAKPWSAQWNCPPATLLPITISGGYSWRHSVTYRQSKNWRYLRVPLPADAGFSIQVVTGYVAFRAS